MNLNRKAFTEVHFEILHGLALKQSENLGRLRIHDGHNIFKYNITTGELGQAETRDDGGKVEFKYEPGCIYIFTLNIKNAIIKLNKLFDSVVSIVESSESPTTLSFKGASDKPVTEPVDLIT